jgi:hypothetical protein
MTLDDSDLQDLRQLLGREIGLVMSVRALVDVVTSYAGPDDVVRSWLRSHNPVMYFHDSMCVFVSVRNGDVYACNTLPDAASAPGSCSVTKDYTIKIDDIRLSLNSGNATRYVTRQMDVTRHTISYGCTSFPSHDGSAAFLTVSSMCGCKHANMQERSFTMRKLGLGWDPTTLEEVVWPADRVSFTSSNADVMEAMAALMTTYVFPEEMMHWLMAGSPGRHTGVVRLHPSGLRIGWTEVDGTGTVVRRTAALQRALARLIGPLVPLMRARKLGVEVARHRAGWKCTLVDEQAEYMVPRAQRKRRQPVRFSPT